MHFKMKGITITANCTNRNYHLFLTVIDPFNFGLNLISRVSLNSWYYQKMCKITDFNAKFPSAKQINNIEKNYYQFYILTNTLYAGNKRLDF